MDSVLQYKERLIYQEYKEGHNPCFSGQCFAIQVVGLALTGYDQCHNPCFSGQCFAMNTIGLLRCRQILVTILVLVDSVLQCLISLLDLLIVHVTILVLVDSVLQWIKNIKF